MKRLILVLPLLLFLGIALFLYRGLFLNPQELPSALIDKPLPAFSLPDLKDGQRLISEKDLKGPALVNVWATWCPTCKAEHQMLNRLAKAGVVIHGVNYKDDGAAARQWLQDYLDPYQVNVADPQGSLGINLGVYGAPETFLIDAQGIIRHKYVGAIDEKVWREELAPRYQALLEEKP
ncbi:TPA: DsbE family thiol:disulfide interchange protein [Pseudomonas aeruginosa]|jgi:cytochrome c biogenesis protein CcmG/thiol:disulfide interchange protein DsbE|uniref:DsbE family thiol:disulfide interchange protein n=1 Tax=Pseudomonas TaxID=286 RepID=UPI00038FD8D8|nr:MULTISPECIES: DsbE family thiol:disulfide interchange protein [Pseudomonas]KIL02456.1 thiol:disulfide interchange protein [Stutzerimonas stutzeri]EKN0212692.1 DsbE family thiol:disulfide interchange protein [Pseudomonas aeruginosa]EKT8164446.1 DsbE family thiol:disulfide interchange protein [Pseudomonas aeruginosa]EKU3717561.1 DsbE family thiol:disulfide interchange protein [Pseudomonas aeruginosa]EKW9639373.1 DsbE family thiol:disulfide interchange protein [Pseudomonas aeruginosa]